MLELLPIDLEFSWRRVRTPKVACYSLWQFPTHVLAGISRESHGNLTAINLLVITFALVYK